MSVRSSDSRAPTPPQKRSRASASGSASSSRATTPVDKPLPPSSSSSLAKLATKKPRGLRVDTTESALECVTCGGVSANPSDFMACCHCPNIFHAKCANLPSVPEEGDIFCRWSCFTNFHKASTAAAAAVERSKSDFPQLAVQIRLLLQDETASAPRHALPVHYHTPVSRASNGAGQSNGRRLASRPVSTVADERHGDDRRSSRRSSAMDDSANYSRYHTTANDRPGRPPARQSNRSASPSPTRGASSYSSHRRGASRVSPSAVVGALETDFGRSAGHVGALGPTEATAAAGRSVSSHARTRAEAISGSSAAPLTFAHALHDAEGDLVNGGSSRSDSYRASSALHQQPLDGAIRGRTSLGSASGGPSGRYRSSHAASLASSSEHDHRSRVASNGKALRYASASGPPPPPPVLSSSSVAAATAGAARGGGASSIGPSASVRPLSHAKEADVPWLNPSAFPAGMHERFACHADDLNRVFRVDLTPAFADKATHLYQSEIDFFFRCFESSDVSLVVKGMASELNACMWTWPFVLESVGADACFAFERFQYTRASRDGASQSRSSSELEYVGELKLSLGAYAQYLDKFLSLPVVGKDAIVLDDQATKESVTMLVRDNVIALHSLVVAQSCAKLHSDLRNSFQWDVFAGGIHCLLQYLPESCRSDKFASPVLHFTFPGARGALCDPGNGTTDTAYQVLTGSLELVIFERMEPRHRDEFARILRRAGYHVEKKPMLQEAHLRALSSAGFVWTTVKIHDGEFIHINKGRMHFWRAVARIAPTSAATAPRSVLANEPCVFLSWEWVYQGVSQRGISTECWFAMKNASLCSSGWAFDPRRAIIEAAKTGVATVRSGQFLTTHRSALFHALSFASGSSASAAARMLDAGAVSQRQMQMVLFLESILQCLKTIVDDEYDLALAKDDSEVFGKRFDGEALWKVVDADLVTSRGRDPSAYACGVCGLELTNIYKQCLGCTAYASTCQPNMSYKLFRLCLRCHAHPKHHHFKPRALHGYYGKLLSCEGHTGAPQSALDPNFFECACAPSLPCGYCGGCQSCSCVCHTQFQTRFRFASPESLDRLRFDVEEVVRFHKQAAVVAR